MQVGGNVDFSRKIYPWYKGWLENNYKRSFLGYPSSKNKNNLRFYLGSSREMGSSFNVDFKAKEKKMYLFNRKLTEEYVTNVKMFSYLTKQTDEILTYARCKPVKIK